MGKMGKGGGEVPESTWAAWPQEKGSGTQP